MSTKFDNSPVVPIASGSLMLISVVEVMIFGKNMLTSMLLSYQESKREDT